MYETAVNRRAEAPVLGAIAAKVKPILEDDASFEQTESGQQLVITVDITSADDLPADQDDGGLRQIINPQDDWLPVTESRKGNTLTAAFHLTCSGIGGQALLLPIAFISLGWFWGIFCLSVAFWWQLYTIWLLVNLHESAPGTGIRYSRYLHLSIVAFGEKLGKLIATIPLMYLSGGTCVVYIIAGGNIMDQFYQVMCENNLECKAKTLTVSEWFLVFICLAIFTALFFPNLNKLSHVSLIGSITAVAFCSLLWIMSVSKGRQDGLSLGDSTKEVGTSNGAGIRNVLNGIGIICLAFRGHNLVLEIQGTLPTNSKQPSHKPMWRGVAISYLLIAMCLYPLAIVGYWAYGNKVSMNGGILGAFTKLHHNHTSKYIIGAIYLIIFINYLCTFQIYAMIVFDNLEHIYTRKKNEPCPRWLRSAIKVLFGGLTYFIAVAFPFLPSLGALVGSIVLPLTLVYPCFMWVSIKKPSRFSKMWCLNLGVGILGIVLSIVLVTSALWSLIVNGLDANFFKPR